MVKILLYLNLLFTGCSFGSPIVMTRAENHAMDYYQWLVTASPSAFPDEMEVLDQQNGMNPIVRFVRKALLLSVPAEATYEDEKQALQLLQQSVDSPYASNDEARDYQQFALIWKKVIERRLELKDAINSLAEDLREKQGAIRKLEEDNAAYGKKVEDLNGQIQSLNKQIEELKLIEQQIHDREQSLDNTAETESGR